MTDPQPDTSANNIKANEKDVNLLLDEDYSIENVIRQAQEKNLSLSSLRDQLISHQQELNQISLDLFNNNYDRFFKLSHFITCLNEPIENVIHPIELYHNRLDELCRQYDEYLAKIDQKIVDLEETNRNKLMTSKIINLIKKRDRIIDQISRLEWLKKTNSFEHIIDESNTHQLEHKINCDSIERLTVELHYLHCEISAIKPTNDELIPIKQLLESSVIEQQKELTSWFRRLFHIATQHQCQIMIDFVLRTFRQIS